MSVIPMSVIPLSGIPIIVIPMTFHCNECHQNQEKIKNKIGNLLPPNATTDHCAGEMFTIGRE